MVESIKEFIQTKENMKLVIIVASFLIIFLALVIAVLVFNAKKKKYRKSLDLLREKIQILKQHEVINNYSTYDNLKNDQKLGMLVLRWKKAIENLVKEIDAQYSMLDVLEDAINQNNYTYFVSMLDSTYKDVIELEKEADKLNDEISEYVDKASDNRKYINKYYEMYQEIKEKFINNENQYTHAKNNIKDFLEDIKIKFDKCHTLISRSKFEDADNIASIIFKEIKFIDYYLEVTPNLLNQLENNILPGFSKMDEITKHFTEYEIKMILPEFINQYNRLYNTIEDLYQKIYTLDIESIENEIKTMQVFVKGSLTKFEAILEKKNKIINQMNFQKEYLEKIENTAKNFVSIFKVAYGSYNISDKEIQEIENLIIKIEVNKVKISEYQELYKNYKISYDDLIANLDATQMDLNNISKYLDKNLKVIDEIYSDEKQARIKIASMTEKINGCKKFIKFAYLDDQGKYLKIIKNLNLELSQLYMVLSTFPIDIVRLNSSLNTMLDKVEKTTQEINGAIYKTLLTEFVILYANRFFSQKEYQKEILIAENLFYNNSLTKAYNKIMDLLDSIGPQHKKIVLEKYQEKFSELFS